jgi:hypothetical protein
VTVQADLDLAASRVVGAARCLGSAAVSAVVGDRADVARQIAAAQVQLAQAALEAAQLADIELDAAVRRGQAVARALVAAAGAQS